MSNDILSWVKYAREVEIHKAGNAQGLIDWYNNGADGQINWGAEGDFADCVAIAGKHIDNPEGFCQLRHIDATGAPAGKAGSEIAKGDFSGHPFRGNQYANQEDYEQAKDVASKAKDLANFASKVQNTPDADPNKVHNLQDIADKHAELARAHFDLADKTNGLVSQLHFQAALAHDSASKQAGDFARSGNRTNIVANASTASAASQVAAGVPISKADDEPDYTKLISNRKGAPSDQDLYNQVKADAQKKFDVYPSAVANGWVVQEYKRRGGTYHKPVTKGDVAGHPFHGNQWTEASGLGEQRSNLGHVLEPGSRENKAEIDAVTKGHIAAAKAHMSAAQEAVKSKDYGLAQKHFEASVAHSKAADEASKLAETNAKLVSAMGGKVTEEKWANVPTPLKQEWTSALGNSTASQEASVLTRAIAAGR